MNRFMNFTARMAAPAIVFAAVSAPALAQPAPQFTVTESPAVTGGTTTNSFRADRIQGSYIEDFTTTGGTPASGSFTTQAYFTATGYSLNEQAVSGVQLNGVEPGGYRLYALFNANGTFTNNAGDRTFTGSNGSVSLYLDPQSNTARNDANLGSQGTNTGDDRLLGSSSLLGINSGNIRGGDNNGDFRLTFDNFSLTDAGRQFLTDPNPFYSVVTIRGNFNSFNIPAIGLTARIGGSANAAFELVPGRVPEPGSLALMSVAMLGLAAAARRRKS